MVGCADLLEFAGQMDRRCGGGVVVRVDRRGIGLGDRGPILDGDGHGGGSRVVGGGVASGSAAAAAPSTAAVLVAARTAPPVGHRGSAPVAPGHFWGFSVRSLLKILIISLI